MTDVSPDTSRGTSSTARRLGALLALSIGAFLFVTTENLPIGLLLDLSAGLRVPTSWVGLLVTGYGLVVVLTTIPLTRATRGISSRVLMAAVLGGFVVTTAASAASGDFWVLAGARMTTALSQALFWSLVIPTAAGLFGPAARGRAVAVVFAGTSLATVLGIPVGTSLGQAAGWRLPFILLAGVGALAVVAVVVLLPSSSRSGAVRPHPPGRPEPDPVAQDVDDRFGYRLLVVLTVLFSTGAFVSYTYLAQFLVEISSLSATAVAPVLLLRGLVGLAGVVLAGAAADRWPRATTVAPLVLQSVALLGLFASGTVPVVAVSLTALAGMAFAVFTTALGTQVLRLAPSRPELASAGTSVAMNVGIAGGGFLGGLLLGFGVRGTALLAGGLSAVAAALALAGPALRSAMQHPVARPGPARPGHDPCVPAAGVHR